MHELVIVIADLYLPHGAASAYGGGAPDSPPLAGIEYVGRFGERTVLEHGWRAWLAHWLGRADLAEVAPAYIAAAALRPPAAEGSRAAASAAPLEASTWIATPLHLDAGLSRVHLEHRGILPLTQPELAALATAFHATFGSSGLALTPLASGDFLLEARGIRAVPSTEPARFAGTGTQPALPPGPAAGPLRRLTTEIEMWLHSEAWNEARISRGEAAVTTLWLWGGDGRTPPAPPAPGPPDTLAFGCEAYLSGLWHLLGGMCRPLPTRLEEVLTDGPARRAVLVAQIGRELQCAPQCTVGEALARLDARLVVPALQALRRGELARLTLIANDTRLRVGRASGLRLWRRPRAALERFA